MGDKDVIKEKKEILRDSYYKAVDTLDEKMLYFSGIGVCGSTAFTKGITDLEDRYFLLTASTIIFALTILITLLSYNYSAKVHKVLLDTIGKEEQEDGKIQARKINAKIVMCNRSSLWTATIAAICFMGFTVQRIHFPIKPKKEIKMSNENRPKQVNVQRPEVNAEFSKDTLIRKDLGNQDGRMSREVETDFLAPASEPKKDK